MDLYHATTASRLDYIVDADQVVILKVRVERKHLTRRWRGLWSASVTITNIIGFENATKIMADPIAD